MSSILVFDKISICYILLQNLSLLGLSGSLDTDELLHSWFEVMLRKRKYP